MRFGKRVLLLGSLGLLLMGTSECRPDAPGRLHPVPFLLSVRTDTDLVSIRVITLAVHSNGLATIGISRDGPFLGDAAEPFPSDAAAVWVGVARVELLHDSLRAAGAGDLNGAQSDCLMMVTRNRRDIFTYYERISMSFTAANTFSTNNCPMNEDVRQIRTLVDQFVVEYFGDLLP